jgi:hypothetical protein
MDAHPDIMTLGGRPECLEASAAGCDKFKLGLDPASPILADRADPFTTRGPDVITYLLARSRSQPGSNSF